MNEQQLLRAVGDAKPEYLAQSEETKKTAQPWKRWTALAACACLIVGLGAAAFAFVTRGASSTPEASPGSAVSGNSAADGASADPSAFLAYAGPVMPLTLREEAPELSASRKLTVDFAPYAPETNADGSEADARRAISVTDDYTLTNGSDHDVTVTAVYPFVSTVREVRENSPVIFVNGEAVQAEVGIGRFASGFAPTASPGYEDSTERMNLRDPEGWEDYAEILKSDDNLLSAFEPLPALEETVYVYTLTPTGEPMVSPATIAMTCDYDPERTTILTVNFNGSGSDEETQLAQYSFFVSQNGTHYLAALGEDVREYTIQGYEDGGCDPREKLDGLSADVTREEMTLDAFLRLAVDDILATYQIYGQGVEYARDTASFAFYYRAAVEFLLNYGVLSDDPAERYAVLNGYLDMMLTDSWVVERVGYAAFEVTIPAGKSVTVTAQLTKEHSYNFWGSGHGRENVDGYDFLTGAASKLLFTEETAELLTRGIVEIMEQNIGFDPENGVTEVTIDPDAEHLYLNVCKLGEE